MTPPDITVFIIEDDEAVARSLTRALRKRGYPVEDHRSAESFLAEFDALRCGCLLLDYGLPDMNGLELQNHLNEIGAHLPVIFITGHGGVPESVQAMKAGAVDFLLKPYKTAELIGKIEMALDLSRTWMRTAQDQEILKRSLNSLTEREKEIFELMMGNPDMASSKAIARALDISPRTADIHRARILTKTDCTSVADLVSRFMGKALGQQG